MEEKPLTQSSSRRAWEDTKRSFHSIMFFWGVEVAVVSGFIYLATILTPEDASRFVSGGYQIAGAIIGAVVGFGIIYLVMLFRAPFKQRNEARIALISTLGATPNSPKVASPELHFEHIDYKFVGDNPPLLLINFDAMPTGSMYLEQAKIEILGGMIPFTDWETCDISPSVSRIFTNHCEIKGGLPMGNHEIRIQVYANREWWASDWQTITYSPSVPDKEGS